MYGCVVQYYKMKIKSISEVFTVVFCLQHHGELVILIFWSFGGTSGYFYPEQGGRNFLGYVEHLLLPLRHNEMILRRMYNECIRTFSYTEATSHEGLYKEKK
jgi:hypothetical protein